jgi:hypothetical protein
MAKEIISSKSVNPCLFFFFIFVTATGKTAGVVPFRCLAFSEEEKTEIESGVNFWKKLMNIQGFSANKS